MVKATRLALYLVVLILAFGTCELLLRMAGAVSLHTHRLLLAPWENASITIWRDGVGLRGNPDHHDEAGYRDGSRPTQAETVVLDDSHAYGAGVESWPRRLAHFSARRVQNMARPATEPGPFLASAAGPRSARVWPRPSGRLPTPQNNRAEATTPAVLSRDFARAAAALPTATTFATGSTRTSDSPSRTVWRTSGAWRKWPGSWSTPGSSCSSRSSRPSGRSDARRAPCSSPVSSSRSTSTLRCRSPRRATPRVCTGRPAGAS